MKFPPYIYNNPAYEDDPEVNFLARLAGSAQQKQDFTNALDYAEKEILSVPPSKWTAELLLVWLQNLHKRAGATLCKEYAGVYRTMDSAAVNRESPILGKEFNLKQPDYTFGILLDSYGEGAASCFLRWHLKEFYQRWLSPPELLASLDGFIVEILRKKSINIDNWRAKYFAGKSVQKWREDFFAEYPQFVDETDNSRYRLQGLFTPDELLAQQKVIKYFVPPEEISPRMQAMAAQAIAMLQNDIDPIEIAAYLHLQYTAIHPHENGNGRVVRIMLNSILMLHGYPAVQLELQGVDKREYCLALEKGDENVLEFAVFLRHQVSRGLANSLCVAARDNNLAKIILHIRKGIDVNCFPDPATKYTALHYACAKENWEAASLLVKAGGNLNIPNGKGETALGLAKRKSMDDAGKLLRLSLDIAKRDKLAQSLQVKVSSISEEKDASAAVAEIMPSSALTALFATRCKHNGSTIAQLVADYALELEDQQAAALGTSAKRLTGS